MPTPTITDEPFTTETNDRGQLLYKVDLILVAAVFPSPEPFNPDAWHVALFDPFGAEHGGGAASEAQAKIMAAILARTAARAVSR